jgi:hypothetical protein
MNRLGTGHALAIVALLTLPAVAAEPAWVTASNANTKLVLSVQGRFNPEQVSKLGMPEYDGRVSDVAPGRDERCIATYEALQSRLTKQLAAEKDANVQQDIEILLGSVERDITGTRLEKKYYRTWVDVPKAIFEGVQGLLNEQVAPQRRAKAADLLRRYVGQYPGTRPTTELVKASFRQSGGNGRQGPFRTKVEESIANTATYVKGIRDAFAKYKIEGAEPALKAMEAQFAQFNDWQRQEVMPTTRSDPRLPPELYAFTLKTVGVDVDPQVLIQRGMLEFMETRAAIAVLAPLVAKEKGFKASAYQDVIRELKNNQIPNDRIEAHYADVNRRLEAIIQRERVVNLPQRPMLMRLASAAESAANPSPHMEPPPLIGNTGERGQFVLALGNSSADGKSLSYDDFSHPAATWTISAHEGRPGHELQFTAMVERGVSQARSLFAFNSVNVEGWALYAEAEMLPHLPLEGQLIALQFRLFRAARAFLDPMINLGMIDRAGAERVLEEEVGMSAAFAKEDLDRYTFRSPGQATAYFYGYIRIMQLRAETELALGSRFDRLAFHNFLLDQGLLPPDLLATAVREKFIPSQKVAAK